MALSRDLREVVDQQSALHRDLAGHVPVGQHAVPPQQGAGCVSVVVVIGSVAGFVARMMAECMPSATSCVGVISTAVKPAAVRPSRYSVTERAPAMQPTYEPRSARSSGVRA